MWTILGWIRLTLLFAFYAFMTFMTEFIIHHVYVFKHMAPRRENKGIPVIG